MPLRVGITGGIGSGKSTVALIFEVLGIPVYYADNEAKVIMNHNVEVRNILKNEFGEKIYKDEVLDRAYLASIVFNDKAKLERLNFLVHPVTIQAAEDWMLQQQSPYVLKEAALIFESGAAEKLDYVIGVSAPLALRTQRAIRRDNLTREQVQLRMNRQIDDSLKMKLCDLVLINDEQQLLTPQVLRLHLELLELAKARS